MMRRTLLAIGAVCCCSLVHPGDAGAATFRVDDSATIPQESSATLRWKQLAPSRGGDNTVEGATSVQVRLNLAPWLKRNGRLFLVLPEQSLGQVRASWTTQGRLLPGSLMSGQRALVYAGPIMTPLIDETLVLKIETDGTRLGSAHRLNFHFEIDID
jgi:hypothetical protein